MGVGGAGGVPGFGTVEEVTGVVFAEAAYEVLFQQGIPGVFRGIVALVVEFAPLQAVAAEHRETATGLRIVHSEAAA